VWAYRRDAVWASARDAQAKRSFGAAGLLDLRNPRNRSEKFELGHRRSITPIRSGSGRTRTPTRVSLLLLKKELATLKIYAS